MTHIIMAKDIVLEFFPVIRNIWFLHFNLLRRHSKIVDVGIIGSIPVYTDFFLISCDSNQVPKWFGSHYNLEVPL